MNKYISRRSTSNQAKFDFVAEVYAKIWGCTSEKLRNFIENYQIFSDELDAGDPNFQQFTLYN